MKKFKISYCTLITPHYISHKETVVEAKNEKEAARAFLKSWLNVPSMFVNIDNIKEVKE